MLIACQKAEVKKTPPNPTKIETQKKLITLWTQGVQNLCDLKIRKATIVYQIKSQDQWTPAKTEKPINPKSLAFKIRVVPTVNHHRINPGLNAVVRIPANRLS